MPGLIAFSRRWGIGSDDFVIPAAIEVTIRMIWFIAVSLLYLKHRKHLFCGDGQQLLQVYLTVLLIGLAVIMVLSIVIAVISSRGTITQTRPRYHLPKLLYLRFLLIALEIVWNAIGTKWAFTPGEHLCESKDVIVLVQIIVIGSWILLGIILFGVFMVFDPIGSHSQPVCSHRVGDVEQSEPQALYINLNSSNIEKAKRVWEWRMRVIFCCFGAIDEESKSAYIEIAKLFAEYFEDIDLVPSDIAAGLILLHQKQMHEKKSRVSALHQSEVGSVQSPDSVTSTGAVQGSILSSPGVFTPMAQQFWMTLDMACHFMKFSQGSYGWPMFLYSDGLTGLCRLWSGVKCCACCYKPPSYIVDDNCCHCHTAALKKVTGLTDEDLIYVSFHNRVYEVPFFVAVDHQTCSVVVSIRGTLSLFDALTDLSADCDHLVTDMCPLGLHCHRGILRAAQFVRRKLDESSALSDAFALHQNYSLVITGHSLGAGAAAILAVLLRPMYPNVKCFAFGPPGGLLSIDGVRHTEEFVLSVTLGDDLVPRLSVPNLEDMKKRVLSCILDCDTPKYKIFVKRVFSCFDKNKPGTADDSAGGNAMARPLLEHFGQNNSSGNYTTNSSQEGSSEGSATSGTSGHIAQARHFSHVPLYLPGRILHITFEDSTSFQAQWVTVDYFNQIIISPHMISDHMPHLMYHALSQLTNNQGHQFIP